jgi:hypothetical protein
MRAGFCKVWQLHACSGLVGKRVALLQVHDAPMFVHAVTAAAVTAAATAG